MKRNLLKISIVVALIIATLFVFFVPQTLAKTEFNPWKEGFDTISKDKGNDIIGASKNIMGSILNIVQIVAVGVAIIMLIVLAIKYISSAPNDKAEIKKHAVVYIVGAFVLFASAGILGVIKKFAGNIKKQQ